MLIPSNDKQNKNEILKIEASASHIASWTKNTTEFVTFSMAKIRIDILNAVSDILFSQVDAAEKKFKCFDYILNMIQAVLLLHRIKNWHCNQIIQSLLQWNKNELCIDLWANAFSESMFNLIISCLEYRKNKMIRNPMKKRISFRSHTYTIIVSTNSFCGFDTVQTIERKLKIDKGDFGAHCVKSQK